jgi:DNA-binding MarR family transcriptional regulator
MLLKLTAKGAREFQRVNKVSDEQISSLISTLDPAQLIRLTNNMTEIQKILEHKD